MRLSRRSWAVLWSIGVFALTGCGSDGDGGGSGPGSGGGTVNEKWAGFCTATFTQDTPIVDAFGESTFTAQAGDEYLLSDFSDSFGDRAELLYLGSGGPDSFEVEPSADGGWPFTSNCTINAGVPYYAVFKNVSVFAEKELTTKICDLTEGSVLPAGTSGGGYSLSGVSGSSAIYQVLLGPFGAQCGGASQGFVRLPQTTSFGSTTWLIPIARIIGPE